MSFEHFNFYVDLKKLPDIRANLKERQSKGEKFQKMAWEIIHDFLYDYGVRYDDIKVIETAGFTRIKLFFRHEEGVLEFFQNHKWENAEQWREKTAQKHLSPIMILPTGENEICLDFFNGDGDKPSLYKVISDLQKQKNTYFTFSPGMDFEGYPVFLDGRKNILVGGTLGSGTISLAYSLILQSIYNLPENIPIIVLVDPQGIDLSVLQKLSNIYRHKNYSELKEVEDVFEELMTEIGRDRAKEKFISRIGGKYFDGIQPKSFKKTKIASNHRYLQCLLQNGRVFG